MRKAISMARGVKDAHEQDTMRRAAQISAQAHIRAMQTSARMLRAGQDAREYHLEAELLHEFRQHGSQFPAYTSITGLEAKGPMSPKPNTAEPLVITATKLPLLVYL